MRQLFLLILALFTISCSHSSGQAQAAVAYAAIPVQPQIKVIVLDAGHGGTDHGARCQGIVEKHRTLSIANLTKKHLNSLGYRVILTRDRDDNVPLQRRVAIANKHKDALFVSIHLNSAPAKEASGVEIFFCDKSEKGLVKESKKLAHSILSHMIEKTSAESRGVKRGTFHVIRETEVPSVLVEAGFITNRAENISLKENGYINQLAEGIAHGIHAYVASNSF